MIRYALKCAEGHNFESWFQSAEAFETLADRRLVSCAVCGSSDVKKALMAPGVAVGEATAPPQDQAAPATSAAPAPEAGPLSAPQHPAEQVLRAIRKHLAENSTYVGPRFAEEARAMHLGDRDQAAIHGEASTEEARALIEDGIEIAPLPVLPPDKAN
ncbi:hypothetical protein roselon_02048 [Roseibacterium elongatum DSM 19469]|uniref:DUF1178 family protein n=1 Tax=Roseicyclus elongatus DSM 19469 TaxID=1294273 RepID=W8RT78_9RHOB|nr:DUF1178 family protein [Roseibacterium elongatum]AHM04399.1 hypothetical protein roselon_02048 [Roseibacterium elongatum DSM 19469]